MYVALLVGSHLNILTSAAVDRGMCSGRGKSTPQPCSWVREKNRERSPAQ
ncbi:hypothetical protein BFJ69_g843 [Fusarium oxysporum]|uniref:Uncharacterized protein n=1 Tax=Fusarium oxysporum TaxID=5507 RepID=A0A420P255_FUSOX|nr:hypothetical protein BFJ69_g843 [Fusarium oxysporum]